MDKAGLATGVVGLAGLFSTCQDVFDKFSSYKSFDKDAEILRARIDGKRCNFFQWCEGVGYDQYRRVMTKDTHPALENSKVRTVVAKHIKIITDICQLQIADGGSAGKKLAWAFRRKADSEMLLVQLSDMIRDLRDLVPTQRTRESSLTDAPGFGYITEPLEARAKLLSEAQKKLHDVVASLKRDEDAHTLKFAQAWILGTTHRIDTYDQLMRKRLEGTCEWVFDDPTFQQWLSTNEDEAASSPHVLWIHGPPAFGKTMLCSRLVQHFKAEDNCSSVAYFFNSLGDEKRDDPLVVIRSWISQLAVHPEASPTVLDDYLADNFQIATDTKVLDLFRKMLQRLPDCTLIADGLDELSYESSMSARSSVDDLFNALKNDITTNKTRVLLVSQDRAGIRSALQKAAIKGILEIKISPQDVSADIRSYSEHLVQQKLSNKSQDTQTDISKQLADKCAGQFLWLRLQAGFLSGGLNRKQLQRAIDRTPPGLDSHYNRTWEKIDCLNEWDKSRAKRLLRWVALAFKPLNIGELTEAVLIDEDSDEFPVDELPDEMDETYINDQILRLCDAFVEIREDSQETRPRNQQTITLVHFSVKEYLLGRLSTGGCSIGKNSIIIQREEARQHSMIARLCLHYISYERMRGIDSKSEASLLEYAAVLWIYHHWHGLSDDEHVLTQMRRFFRPENTHFHAWRRIFHALCVKFGVETTLADGLSANPLMYASIFGLDTIVSDLGQAYPHMLGAQTSEGITALHMAVYGCNATTVEKLLELGADVSVKEKNGLTALHLAAARGCLETTEKILIHCKNDISELTKDPVALILASRYGSSEVLQLLLSHQWSMGPLPSEMSNTPEWEDYGVTALDCAVIAQNVEKVKLLLDAGHNPSAHIDPTCTSKNILAPVQLSASSGDIEILHLLLKKGANVDQALGTDLSALTVASSKGHLEIVKILRKYKADVSLANDSGCTPLHVASQNGHAAIVEFLLNEGADVNARQGSGHTPLAFAARFGHIEIAELLLKHGADLKGSKTPIMLLAARSSLEMVEYMHGRGVSVNVQDVDGATPLIVAAHVGNSEVVDRLCDLGALVNARTHDGITALECAATEGHETTVQTLCRRGADLQPSSHRDVLWSPLIAAACYGRLGVVKILLKAVHEADAPAWDDIDVHERTALGQALTQGHTEVVKVLLGHNVRRRFADSIPYGHRMHVTLMAAGEGQMATVRILSESEPCPDSGVHSLEEGAGPALHWSAKNNYPDAVQFLLDSGAPCDVQDRGNMTPLHVASRAGSHEVVKILCAQGASVDISTPSGTTALHLASFAFHPKIIEILVQYNADLEAVDHSGQTPLFYAAGCGNDEAVQQLLKLGAKVNVTDDRGWTPLFIASKEGKASTVRLLLQNGADATIPCDCGNTPLSVACTEGHMSVVELLATKYEASAEEHFQIFQLHVKRDPELELYLRDEFDLVDKHCRILALRFIGKDGVAKFRFVIDAPRKGVRAPRNDVVGIMDLLDASRLLEASRTSRLRRMLRLRRTSGLRRTLELRRTSRLRMSSSLRRAFSRLRRASRLKEDVGAKENVGAKEDVEAQDVVESKEGVFEAKESVKAEGGRRG